MKSFPMARTHDPETSHQAAEQHRPRLSLRRRQILILVKGLPDATSGELSVKMYSTWGKEGKFPIYREKSLSLRTCAETPHKRLSELEKLGLVYRSGKRKCRDSGYEAVTWRACSVQGEMFH